MIPLGPPRWGPQPNGTLVVPKRRPRDQLRLPYGDSLTPEERLIQCGGSAVTDAELLGIVVSRDADLADDLLRSNGGLAGLLSAKVGTLETRGCSRTLATTLCAIVELSRRLARAKLPKRRILGKRDTLASYLMLRYAREDQEVLGALYIDIRDRLIADEALYRGTMDRTAVEPRLIIKQGLAYSAASIILFHTHPSGDPAPSVEDLQFTRRLAEAGEIMGIRLRDHLIIGHGGRFVSLQMRGVF